MGKGIVNLKAVGPIANLRWGRSITKTLVSLCFQTSTLLRVFLVLLSDEQLETRRILIFFNPLVCPSRDLQLRDAPHHLSSWHKYPVTGIESLHIKPWLCHLLPQGPGTSSSTPLSLRFLICKTEALSTSQAHREGFTSGGKGNARACNVAAAP